MKIKLILAASDGGDGSIKVNLVNTREEALEILERTEEQMNDKNHCFYDDGLIEEIELEIEDGKLVKPFWINIE